MGKRLSKISLDLINRPEPRECAPETLDNVLVGITLGCVSHLLPVALLGVVTFTTADPMLAIALTFFIHSEVRHAQGRRRAFQTHTELVNCLRQLAPLRGETRYFVGLVTEVSQRFHRLAFVEVFVAPLVSVGASAAIAVLVGMHIRFRLIDIVLPTFAGAAATFAWLRFAHWQVRSLLPTKFAVLTLLLIAAPFSAFASAAGVSRTDGPPLREGAHTSVTGPDRHSRAIDKPANFGCGAAPVCLEAPTRRSSE
jgi:hypothetical protein